MCVMFYVAWLSRNCIIFLHSYVRNKKTLIIQEVCFPFIGLLKALLEIELIFFSYSHLNLKFVLAIEQNLHHFLNQLIFLYKFTEWNDGQHPVKQSIKVKRCEEMFFFLTSYHKTNLTKDILVQKLFKLPYKLKKHVLKLCPQQKSFKHSLSVPTDIDCRVQSAKLLAYCLFYVA